MPNHLNDLTGKRAGILTPLKCIGKIKRRSVWRCRCDCGAIAIVRGSYLARAIRGDGGTKSCGCLRKNNAIEQAEGARAAR